MKKKVLYLILAFAMAVSPLEPLGSVTICKAGVKQDGEKNSILNDSICGGKQESSSKDEFQPVPPERFPYERPSVNIPVINGTYIDGISDQIITGTVSEDVEFSVDPVPAEPTIPSTPTTPSTPLVPSVPPLTDNVENNNTDTDTKEPAKPTEPTKPTKPTKPTEPAKPIEKPSSSKPNPDIPDTVLPDPDEAACAVLNASSEEITANAKGILSASLITVDTNGTGGFKVYTEGNPWLKLSKKNEKTGSSSKLSFTDSGSFYLFIDQNKTLESRTETITITHENGTKQVRIPVKQAALHTVLSVDQQSKTADKEGFFYNSAVYVDTNNTGPYIVKIEDGCGWLSISPYETADTSMGLSEMKFSKDGYFYIAAEKNKDAKRTALITVTHAYSKEEKIITVIQLGNEDAFLKLDRVTEYFDDPDTAVSKAFLVTADDDCHWTAYSSINWIKIVKTESTASTRYASIEGTGSGSFYILALENKTYEERSGHVTVSAPGMENIQIYVHQEKNERDLESLLSDINVHASKKTFKRNKTSKIIIDYPEGMYPEDVKTRFSSSNPKAASVNAKGIIKGIREGKAVISTKVILENGKFKTFKFKIAVGKRKVTVTKKR